MCGEYTFENLHRLFYRVGSFFLDDIHCMLRFIVFLGTSLEIKNTSFVISKFLHTSSQISINICIDL